MISIMEKTLKLDPKTLKYEKHISTDIHVIIRHSDDIDIPYHMTYEY